MSNEEVDVAGLICLAACDRSEYANVRRTVLGGETKYLGSVAF
jgi:hypothetical protein